MPILSTTVDLGSTIDRNKVCTASLKGLAAVGRKVKKKTLPLQSSTAMKAKVAQADKGGLMDFFSGLWSKGKAGVQAVKKVSGKVLTAAQKAGVPVPLDKNMAALKTMSTKLRSLIKAMESVEKTRLRVYLAKKDPQVDTFVSSLTKSINQARAQGNAAIVAIDKAVAEAQASQKAMLRGEPSVSALAVFTVKEAQAKTAFNQARLRLEKILSTVQEFDSKEKMSKPMMVKGAAKAAVQTVVEAAQKGTSALVETGRLVEEGITEAGKGGKTLAGMGKYLPILVIGGAVLYIFTAAGGVRQVVGGKE